MLFFSYIIREQFSWLSKAAACYTVIYSANNMLWESTSYERSFKKKKKEATSQKVLHSSPNMSETKYEQ